MKQIVTVEENMTKDRIKKLLSDRKASVSSLANNESERVLFGRQIGKEKSTVSYRLLHAVLFSFPDVDANWLLMGEGSISKAEHSATRIYTQHNELHDGSNNGGTINVGANTTVTSKTIEELESRIAELERDKHYLQALLEKFVPMDTKKSE